MCVAWKVKNNQKYAIQSNQPCRLVIVQMYLKYILKR